MQELFKCEACSTAFNTQLELKEHASVHSGEHEHEHYTCQACGAAFHSSAQLAQHASERHPKARD